ncbi:X-ray repair cross-complementing protein 6-like [Acanthaster planci]|uniref:DNA helicase n=1 Tax=Acanthaster planci TaxID=133434 RepID=A0A8B7ZLD4_ACAPL|nr:X-ray repair cross-complementing protein 6-like [Acanthaster planci]XP_022106424.1 X-ray repair cross-complementing protein 6-like [Acanthaster planci]XP_022106425.1 X-ray repair cross-complementing protein 6-like [Acanthaster planci]XP_022106427.1 X-ray repair cross-complementing protein 6-like [Acanthaster planci]XP_022106428.1 X-ray repair cross-complementing protein 6-like [Acanthaster planci]XP_022106429.1 X-ray repair cross-complementing protein 6-like [Acanthaster planci]
MSNWGGWGTSFGYADGSGDEDEEAESGYQTSFATKDSLIFLVDCGESMFQKASPDEDSHFQLCIKCARSVLTNKIISSDKDLLGVIFFGTEKKKNSGNFDHIYVLQDLDNPSASRILELESLLEDDNDFKTDYGHNTSFSLNDALWTCSNMFSQSTQKIGHKRVLLFTNNDDPHANDLAAQRQAKTKAKDLHEIGIDIELMHLAQPGKEFDYSKFYQDIVFSPDDEDLGTVPDAAEKFEELLNRVRAKDHKKRSLGRLTFSLGEGLDLGVGVFNLVRQQNKPYPVKLYKKTNEQLKSKSRMFCEDTGELLMPTDIKKYQVYGGRNIVFEKEEITDMKNFGQSGLVLMGFKPRSSLKRYLHIRPAQFLFPDESVVKGSTPLFSALLTKCQERDVVAICRFIPRKNSTPFFVALVAQEEELDERNVQVTPPGFHLIYLPNSEDIRRLTLPEHPRANVDQIDKAKEVIKKLQFKFKSENFENPVLQTHYRNLEALALDRDKPDDIVDHTAPDVEMMRKRTGEKIEEFKELVFPDGYQPGAKKRKTVGGDSGKAKPTMDVDMNQYAQQGKLGKLTVAVLKEFCSKNGLSTAGKKNDLIETISSHFGV